MAAGGRRALARRHLLLVDPQRVFIDVLRLRLEPMGCTVDAAYGLAEARALLPRTRPDLVVAAAGLGDGGALELLDDLQRLTPPPEMVVMSDTGEPATVTQALDRGVLGWVLKDDSVTELVGACVGALAGEMYLSHGIVRPVVEHLLHERQKPDTFVAGLSGREREVLACLVAGLDRRQVAARLYLSPNTVRTHIQKLLRAADVHSTIALVAAAREAGVTPVALDDPPTTRRDDPSV